MDISTLSQEQLLELQKLIPAEVQRRQSEDKEKLFEDILLMIQERGFTVDVLGELQARYQKRSVGRPRGSRNADARVKVIRFRHPENPALEWTGAGRRPYWVIEWANAHDGDMSGLRVD